MSAQVTRAAAVRGDEENTLERALIALSRVPKLYGSGGSRVGALEGSGKTTPPNVIGAVVERAPIGAIVGTGLGLALLGWIINVVSRDTYPELGMAVTLGTGSLATTAALGIVAVALGPLVNARRGFGT